MTSECKDKCQMAQPGNYCVAYKSRGPEDCLAYKPLHQSSQEDAVHSPSHYVGQIECIDYLRDKLTPEEFTGFCMGNVLKYVSRWRKKDGVQDLKKAEQYLLWAIESEEKQHA